jgi:hypothetical protein
MYRPLYTLITVALLSLSSTVADAQSYTYSNIRKDYVFDDGFGINQSKTVSQQGDVRVSTEEVYIDGAVYRLNEKGVYKNAKGRTVDLAFSYKGNKLVALRMSTGHIINNYLLDEPAARQDAVVQK